MPTYPATDIVNGRVVSVNGLRLVATASGAPSGSVMAGGRYSPGQALALDRAGNLYAYITGNTWNLIAAATPVPDPVTVAHGGTGLVTLTAHAVYVGNAASAPTALAVGATNSVLQGATGADPAFTTTPTVTSLTTTGALTAGNALNVSAGGLTMNYANAGMELGAVNSANTPFLDFHSSGNNIDYDSRLIADGGTGVAQNGNLTARCANFATSASLFVGGKVTSYNGILTVGWGVPAIYAEARATGNTGANTSVATYTVGAADGSFIVSGNLNITAFTAGTVSMTVAYTDETNTARTTNLSFQSLTGTIGVTAGAAGAFEGIPLHIRCKASTTITFAATVSVFTGTYNAEGCAMEVS